MSVKVVCSICGEKHELGWDASAIFDDDNEETKQYGCDRCLGIERDEEGRIWEVDEQENTYQDVDIDADGNIIPIGDPFVVKRSDVKLHKTWES